MELQKYIPLLFLAFVAMAIFIPLRFVESYHRAVEQDTMNQMIIFQNDSLKKELSECRHEAGIKNQKLEYVLEKNRELVEILKQ